MRRKSSLAAARKIALQAGHDADGDHASGSGDDTTPPLRKRPRTRSRARSQSRRKDASDSASEDEDEDTLRSTDSPTSGHPKAKGTTGGTTGGKPVSRKKSNGSSHKSVSSLFNNLVASAAAAAAASSPTISRMPPSSPTLPPLRSHNLSYHIPLLLGPLATESRHSLLSWFDSVSTTRRMPWRKPWIDPSSPLYSSDPSALRSALERRAYEVWISEIMLQQTRVAVVIDYWTRWMARWPTIHDLAVATPDDVLSAWRGLGYYSRATRIHHAARLVVADPAMRGLLPRDVAELERKLPGVGRYTAGALAAIVFGLPAPMVDGNVLRVLSRQLGLFVNVKTDRAAVDLLWAAADALVHAVATCTDTDGPRDASPARADEEAVCLPNDRPGRWGQALMELGSTVCTPKPNCSQCPVTSTCRAYAEGRALASKPEGEAGTKTGHSPDIEDAICTLCHPFEEASVEDTTGDAEVVIGTKEGSKKPKLKVKKQSTLSVFFQQKPTGIPTKAGGEIEVIVDHCRKFPVKGVKKAVREQETVVCAIRRSDDGSYLITRRPDKGLLAGLWELPSRTLVDARGVDEKASSSKTARSKLAKSHVMEMLARKDASGGQKNKLKNINITHEGELGSVPWLFSHLKLTMHVHLFVLDSGWSDADADADADAGVLCTPTAMQRWASSGGEMDGESMGTGMRRCWAMVRDWEQETFG